MIRRILVDGNNLMFALAEVAVDANRRRLGHLLGDFSERTGLAVTVVFDGLGTKGAKASDSRIAVYYAGRRSADEVLGELAEADSAPRRVLVVSTDRAVQRCGKRRGCRVVDAIDFARRMKYRPSESSPVEPAEKTGGLLPEQLDRWLSEFGLGD